MAELRNAYLVLIFTVISLAAQTSGSKFCIRNDSLQFKDEHRQCEILATAFTRSEEETIHRTMCGDFNRNIKHDYSYLKIRHGILEDRSSYKRLCNEQLNPLLAWVPLQTVRDKIAQGLNKTERQFYIAKATNKRESKTELCYFSQTELLSNDTHKFGCVLMIFEDNFFNIKDDINVLVEILPIRYEIRNVTYEPWTNVTHSHKIVLGKSVLNNPSDVEKIIYGGIGYGFLENIDLDTKAFANGSLEKLPFAFHHKDNIIKLVNGTGSVVITKKTHFGQSVSPRSSMNVDIIGQWSKHYREFHADLYENFGHGFSHYKQRLGLTKISIIKISNIEPVFENPAMIRIAKTNEQSARFTQGGLGENITTVNLTTVADTNNINHPYPEFFPYFIVACILVGLGLLIPIGKMIMILIEEKKSMKSLEY